jgi:hypothetical protein
MTATGSVMPGPPRAPPKRERGENFLYFSDDHLPSKPIKAKTRVKPQSMLKFTLSNCNIMTAAFPQVKPAGRTSPEKRLFNRNGQCAADISAVRGAAPEIFTRAGGEAGIPKPPRPGRVLPDIFGLPRKPCLYLSGR